MTSPLSAKSDPPVRPWARRIVVGALALTVAAIHPGVSHRAYAQEGISFIRDSEIENLMDDYARPIFRAAGLGNQPIKVRIVRQDGFNAFVVDGQNVFINTGTLMLSNTPNQVIGVISHETGHIAGGHLAGLRQRIAQDSTKALLLQVLALGGAIAGAKTAGRNSTSSPGNVMAAPGDIVMRGLLNYRRQQESAADQAGITYLNATKQSAQGMLTTFEEFAKQEYVSAQFQDPYVRSHPMPQDRLSQLRNLAEKSPHYSQKDAPALQLRHDLMRAKLTGFLSDRNPRLVFNKYPPSDTSLPARYARAIARYFQSDIDTALPEIDALIKENPTSPYFLELKGELLFRSGRAKDAHPVFRKALSLASGETSLIRVQLAQALLADETVKNFDEPIDYLRKAIVLENDNPDAYQHLATAYYKKGLLPEADLSAAQSRFFGGNLKEAKSFAKRAQAKLTKGSPGWIKADDIINFVPPKE